MSVTAYAVVDESYEDTHVAWLGTDEAAARAFYEAYKPYHGVSLIAHSGGDPETLAERYVDPCPWA